MKNVYTLKTMDDTCKLWDLFIKKGNLLFHRVLFQLYIILLGSVVNKIPVESVFLCYARSHRRDFDSDLHIRS